MLSIICVAIAIYSTVTANNTIKRIARVRSRGYTASLQSGGWAHESVTRAFITIYTRINSTAQTII